MLLLNLGKRYATKFLLKLESDGDQACDQALQLAGCVLTFQRLYVAHVIYVNRSVETKKETLISKFNLQGLLELCFFSWDWVGAGSHFLSSTYKHCICNIHICCCRTNYFV